MTAGGPEVSIVIPIYRESGFLEGSLRRLVAELEGHHLDYEIILVEQFSEQSAVEATGVLVSQFPCVRYCLLPHADFGLAMRSGMMAAGGDIIVNFDIDYWDVDFAHMCSVLMREFNVDLAIGSKNARLSVDNRALVRRLISQAFRVVLHIAFGLRVSDTHGIKAWRRSPLLLEQITACRFSRDIFDTELVIRCERAGFRLLELPVTVAEQRPPRSSILARLPGAVKNMLELFVILQRERSTRGLPHGAILTRSEPARGGGWLAGEPG
jgi:glycosyltransferase involved in cell wall biosynthesis